MRTSVSSVAETRAGFQDETFRFQVLDEGEYKDRDWRDDLKKLLESTV